MDLVEAAFGPQQVGARRLWSLLVNLPTESAYTAAVLGRAKASWTHTDDLLTLLVNVVMRHRHEWLIRHSKEGAYIEEPESVRSPWEPEPAPPVMSSADELAAFLGTPMRRSGGQP